MLKAVYHTHGCKLNQSETAQISELLAARGIARPTGGDKPRPDLVFINTCAVTRKAAAKSRHTIARMARLYPDAVLVAAGCLAQLDPEMLAQIPGVNYVLGTSDRFKADWWKGKTEGHPIVAVNNNPSQLRPSSTGSSLGRTRPLLKIQDGCNHNCTYCIIPRLRGEQRSVPEDEVLSAARHLVKEGGSEIVLTGVRIGAWGSDLQAGTHLADLVRNLTEIPGLLRIRLGSIEPWELNDELINLVIAAEGVCPHLHIPLQHTHPAVLARMGRPPIDGALALLVEARRRRPDIAIGVDIIAGFPGETQVEYDRLVKVLNNLPISYLHPFSFSPRPGTPAERFPKPVPERVVKQRVARLIEIGRRKRTEFAASQTGLSRIVIPEQPNSSGWIHAVSDNYLRIHIPTGKARPGVPTLVRITHSIPQGLVGIPTGR